jgi:GTP pyrophosphokinase
MESMDDHKVKSSSNIYSPLAHRLGLYNIKTKLEDLGLKYTEPAVYNEIVSKIKETKNNKMLILKYLGSY